MTRWSTKPYGPAAGETDGRTCEVCGDFLRRRRHTGAREQMKHFLARRYCSAECSSRARARAWVDPDGPPWVESDGCWVWDRRINPDGYGVVFANGTHRLAHGWIYEEFVGPVRDGLELDHTCRNRACVNPAHLEQVTHAENVRRSSPHRRVLTADQVAEIRAFKGPAWQIAKAYGVSPTTINVARSGRRGYGEVTA